MPIVGDNKDNNTAFKLPEIGLDAGIIVKILDLGTQTRLKNGVTETKHKLMFVWELPNQTHEGKPMVQSRFVNLAGGDRAELTKIAKACGLPQVEAGFNPKELLGRTCNIEVKHYTNFHGQVKSDIGTYATLMKGQVVPAQYNPLVYFDLDNFDQAIFDSLSDGIKSMIVKSPQYQNKDKPKSEAVNENPGFGMDELEDEIPF